MSAKDVPIVFNLFPRHYKTFDEWAGRVLHVKEMGFNWVFVNPFHETGFSGSLYAVKDYYKMNPYYLKKGEDPTDWTPLKQFIAACEKAGIKVMMDLVINHTASDSPMTKEHPKWYKHDDQGKIVSPFAIHPEEPGKITVWGDLAEIDNEKSTAKTELWSYWEKLVTYFLDMGIEGFRCDAAYKVPATLWKKLISAAKKQNKNAVFMAETLGCTLEQTQALAGTGFDYLFNSSKYWNYDQPWAIEQHEQFRSIAPSISFPESHDTPRLASEKPGSIQMQKSRYALASLFSKGILMPQGYEYGARKALDVVKGSPSDVEPPQWDMSKWVKGVNEFKATNPVASQEGHWRAVSGFDWDLLFLEKTSDDRKEKIGVCINKDWYNKRTVTRQEFPSDATGYSKMIRLFADSLKPSEIPQTFELEPTELVVLVS